jgi:CheY-like chemotaxis protein
MRILCILDKLALLKPIKACCKDNDFELKTITPDDDFDTYFINFQPNVFILQNEYEDLTIKFLIKLIANYESFQQGIKLLIASEDSNIELLTTFANTHDLHLVEEETIGPALCTKVKAMFKDTSHPEVKEEVTHEHLSHRKRILYASDSKFMHIIVKNAFLDNSIEFIDAFDGEEALEKLKSHIPDLVLTDIDIPMLSGLDLCKAIKHSKAYGNIPVVIYSSYLKDDVFEDCLSAGASAYFEKTINPQQLVNELIKFFD